MRICFAKLQEVRAENARLRELLGLDSRHAESHTQSWEPSLFPDTPELAHVDGGSSAEEKLALYQQLFVGRADVFAVRWQNDTSGRSGWSPAVRGGWSKASKARRDYLPLTDEVLAAHLAGRSTVGLYPLLHGDACRLLVCDFDGTSWALDALAYLDACVAAGVPAGIGTVPLRRRRPCVDLLHDGSFLRRRHDRWVPRCCERP